MQVPFHLRRLPTAAPADALLLPTHDAEELLRFCVRLGVDPLPKIHALADGFLLQLTKPTETAWPPAIRLRRRVANLLLPADAELAPNLLDDEASGLVRDRGLIFLPGGRVLAFQPDQPVPLSELLTVENHERRQWRSLPNPRLPAERLREIVLETPPEAADDLLAPGGEGIGADDPRPYDASVPAQLLGKAALTAGKGFLWLGKLPGLGNLGQVGANLVNKAMSLAPRLSESLLGRQEAALRDLLRDFREGNLYKALRRALPLGGSGDRGVVPATGFRLPMHNLFYSLSNILGGSSRGPTAIWFGGYDVQRELADEYRKAAEAATRRGDYRRAAFIYGKLLRDYRLAANVLAQGGLHHDAAVLYLDKVGDLMAAAREFEAGGEADRALQLYRQRGEYVLAGDLLMRLGEEEDAIKEYHAAADKLVTTGDHLAAGELLLTKTSRTDLAATYWAAGWSLRHLSANAVPCAVRLARLYAEEEKPDRLLQLVAEVESHLQAPGDDQPAGQFFNEVAQLADRPNLAAIRGELRDRSLLALAAKLRQRAPVEKRPGSLVSNLLGQCSAWGAPIVSDAAFAFKGALRRGKSTEPTEERDRPHGRIRVNEGIVTAVAQASATGMVFLGFADGAVFGYRPMTGEVVRLPFYHLPVTSIGADAHGQFVVVLRHDPPEGYLASYIADAHGTFQMGEGRLFQEDGPAAVAPTIVNRQTACQQGATTRLLEGRGLIPLKSWQAKGSFLPLSLTSVDRRHRIGEADGDSLHILDLHDHSTAQVRLWRFGPQPGNPLRQPVLALRLTDLDHAEVAGVDEDGILQWKSFQGLQRHAWEQVAVNSSNQTEKYLAGTLLRPGVVVGVTPTRIYWLRAGLKGFTWQQTTRLALPAAIACFPCPTPQALLVVCSDGEIVRVTEPY